MEGKWFKIWFDDKKSIIATMYENLASDLDAGYDPFGCSITTQRREIDEYTQKFDAEMRALQEKDKQHVEHWCYYDLKRRGAID